MLLPVNLSEHELEVARELHDGQTRNEIAGELGLSPHTAHAHCKRIFRKLGIGRAAELRRFALHPLAQHHAQNRVGRELRHRLTNTAAVEVCCADERRASHDR